MSLTKIHIILPKILIEDKQLQCPIFFLAGPIRGGGDWQYQMVKAMIEEAKNKNIPEMAIVIPCQYSTNHQLTVMSAKTINELNGRTDAFDRAVTWERHYLERAAKNGSGCIIFYLPCESQTKPRGDGKPYSMDTRGELGEWRGRMRENPTAKYNVIIGAEPKFYGLSTLKRNFDDALGYDFPIYETLIDTAKRSIEIISN